MDNYNIGLFQIVFALLIISYLYELRLPANIASGLLLGTGIANLRTSFKGL